MSDHNHDEHNDHGHHEAVPAHATEIVPESSFEDRSLVGLIVVCGVGLMIAMGGWMQIEQPSGGGHGHHGESTHSDAGHGGEASSHH